MRVGQIGGFFGGHMPGVLQYTRCIVVVVRKQYTNNTPGVSLL
jgi:hypothetical protein